MSNNLKPYKPDSLWKSIRNKQRKAYAQGLLDAYQVFVDNEVDSGDIEDVFDKVLERYDQLDGEYES